MSERITITAALPYANGPIHIGHLAGVYIPADIFARYQRRKGNEVLFICGSDEHGIPITLRAKKENRTPQEVVNEFHSLIKKTFEQLGISFDFYSRTSSEIHKKTSQDFFLKLFNSGKLIEKEDLQFYDEVANEFLADRYIVGTCPKCGNDNAYGDQCEKCGTSLSPDELINPHSSLSGSIPIKKVTRHWYLPLNEYQEFIRSWIFGLHSKDWRPTVLGQVKSWLDEGLKPRAMTRDLDWGVPVPLPDAKGKVLYVWFDAPIGYISATKEWAIVNQKDWKPYWTDPKTKLYHFIAKDNIVFHCIIFPAMLHAHGDFILPENVPSNEFLNLENDKISTSRNWAVWAHEYLQDFPNGQDTLRYVLTANAPETKDNNFTWKDFQQKNNSELVAIFGNFVNRVVVLAHKYFDGKVPIPSDPNHHVWKESKDLAKEVFGYLDKLEFRNALQAYMNIARLGNQFLQAEEPWKKIKTNPESAANCIFLSAQIVALLAQIGEFFLPEASKKISKAFGMEMLSTEEILSKQWLVESGNYIQSMDILFSKIEDEQVQKQIEKLQEVSRSKKNAMDVQNTHINPQKPECSFDDFSKLDLRICTILSAEKVEKADKLLKIEVDTGVDKRIVVSGIAEYFSPDELPGKQVMILLNLVPRKIRGIESQGMLLLTEDESGRLAFVVPERKVPEGKQVS